PFGSYSYWNYHYNPNCLYLLPSKGRQVYSRPRTFDLAVYNPRPENGNNRSINGKSGSYGSRYGSGRNNDNYRGSGNNAGGFLRDVFSGSGNNSSSSGSTKASSSNNNNSSSGSNRSSGSSSSSSGNSNAGARKF
ncbi:MAG TPA: hypothetical protein VEB42_02220, partial [Chitinophagaceae bacterium]|nr:hypothetical protein [Chitinophagaceae bacterium]